MKATLPATDATNGKNYGGEKETVSTYKLVTVETDGNVDTELVVPVEARAYMGRSKDASVVYATVWVSGNGRYMSGSGRAGGWGYHKESAAIGAAIESAGITLSESIDGVGEGAIRAALNAIADVMGYTGPRRIV